MCAIAVPIILGVAQAGLGIMQAQAAEQAARDQVAFNNMVAEQQFEYQQVQTAAARTTENQRKMMRDTEIQRNTELAQITRANQIAQINVRQLQEAEAASQKQTETAKQALRAAGAIRAQGRIGANVDLLLADVARQQAAFDYYTDRNLAFVNLELQERKKIAQGEYANRVANQTPYLKQTILDPFEKPKQSMPSSTPYMLQAFGSVLGGVSTGLSAYSQMKGAGLLDKPGSTPITASSSSLVGGSSAYTSGLPNINYNLSQPSPINYFP
jgi:hypothetical protein